MLLEGMRALGGPTEPFPRVQSPEAGLSGSHKGPVRDVPMVGTKWVTWPHGPPLLSLRGAGIHLLCCPAHYTEGSLRAEGDSGTRGSPGGLSACNPIPRDREKEET